MAKAQSFFPFILKWEGERYVNDPLDKGGCTHTGVTLATWQTVGYDKNGDGKIDCEDVRLINRADAYQVFLKTFWNPYRANEIKSQSIANIIVDWAWASGVVTALKKVQRLLNKEFGLALPESGKMDDATLQAINQVEQTRFYSALRAAREAHFRGIVAANPSQARFLQGWLNRLNDFPQELPIAEELMARGRKNMIWLSGVLMFLGFGLIVVTTSSE